MFKLLSSNLNINITYIQNYACRKLDNNFLNIMIFVLCLYLPYLQSLNCITKHFEIPIV